MAMLLTWLKFCFAAAAIFWGGKQLTVISNELAETLGLTKGWVGLILLALITSLPEAATSGAASAMGNPDIAIGNLLGSNTFNLAFIGILVLFAQSKSSNLWKLLGYEQQLNGGWFIFLTLAVVFGFTFPIAFGGISLASIVIFIAYFVGMHKIYKYHQGQETEHIPNDSNKTVLYLKLLLLAVLVVGSGVIVARSAEEIAAATGLSNSFVGSFFAAIVTSLPETTVSYHALRIGEMDMAIGNLLGSNLFNTGLLFLAEVFFYKGSIFAFASSEHIFTCVTILVLAGIILFSIRFSQTESRWTKFSPWLMNLIYLNYLWFLAH